MSREQSDQVRAAVERLLDLAGESAARQILADLAPAAVCVELERVVVRRVALRLLEQRAPRAEIRGRLVARGVSERTAYRVIDQALGLGPRISATGRPSLAEAQTTLAGTQPMEQRDGDDGG